MKICFCMQVLKMAIGWKNVLSHESQFLFHPNRSTNKKVMSVAKLYVFRNISKTFQAYFQRTTLVKMCKTDMQHLLHSIRNVPLYQYSKDYNRRVIIHAVRRLSKWEKTRGRTWNFRHTMSSNHFQAIIVRKPSNVMHRKF